MNRTCVEKILNCQNCIKQISKSHQLLHARLPGGLLFFLPDPSLCPQTCTI